MLRTLTIVCRLLVVPAIISGVVFSRADNLHAAVQRSAEPLTRTDVENLLAAGVSSLDILSQADSRGVGYVLSAEVCRQLRSAGAGDQLLIELSARCRTLISLRSEAKRHLALDRTRDAVGVYTQLIERSPLLLDAIIGRALAYEKLGELPAAVADLTTYLQHKSGDARAVLLRGSLHFQLGNATAAANDFTAVCSNPRANVTFRADAWRQRSRLLQTANDFAAARDAVFAAILLTPTDANLYADLSFLLSSSPTADVRNPPLARELAVAAVELTADRSPQRSMSLTALAAAEAAEDKFDAAVEQQLKAIALATAADRGRLEQQLKAYRERKPFRLPGGDSSIAGTEPESPGESANARQPANPIEELLAGLVDIKAGTFRMGEEWYSDDERPQHKVTLDAFRMSAYEVTTAQWAAVMQTETELPTGADAKLPQRGLSWKDCQTFLQRLNQQYGQGKTVFRLPTEAEWEYAARAGSAKAYHFGDEPKSLGDYAWFAGNSGKQPHAVGSRKPNPWGLYDMYGNVGEWCLDAHTEYTAADQKNPGRQPEEGVLRIFRGGSYANSAKLCRSGTRGVSPAGLKQKGLGFRIVAAADFQWPQEETGNTPATTNNPKPSQSTPAGEVASKRDVGLDAVVQSLSKQLIRDDSTRLRRRLVQAAYVRAHVRCLLGQGKLAVQDFTSVLQWEPEGKSGEAVAARCQLAWIHAVSDDKSVRDVETAMVYAEKANSQLYDTPSSWLALTVLAAAHDAAGQKEQARERVQQARDRARRQQREFMTRWWTAIDADAPLTTRELPLPLYRVPEVAIP